MPGHILKKLQGIGVNGIGSESRHGGLLAAIWEVRPTICVNVPLVSASDAPWDFLGVNVIISNKIQR